MNVEKAAPFGSLFRLPLKFEEAINCQSSGRFHSGSSIPIKIVYLIMGLLHNAAANASSLSLHRTFTVPWTSAIEFNMAQVWLKYGIGIVEKAFFFLGQERKKYLNKPSKEQQQ